MQTSLCLQDYRRTQFDHLVASLRPGYLRSASLASKTLCWIFSWDLQLGSIARFLWGDSKMLDSDALLGALYWVPCWVPLLRASKKPFFAKWPLLQAPQAKTKHPNASKCLQMLPLCGSDPRTFSRASTLVTKFRARTESLAYLNSGRECLACDVGSTA